MKKNNFIIYIFILFFISNVVTFSHTFVVNKSNPIVKLSISEVRNIFLGNTVTWKNNQRIQIVDYNSESELREDFSSIYLKLSTNKVSMIWLKVTLSGRVSPPKIFFKERDVLKFVSENKEAIGYIDSAKDLPPDVKIIDVE
jgi:ABC-type phosphate transport system substrate-binding protein